MGGGNLPLFLICSVFEIELICNLSNLLILYEMLSEYESRTKFESEIEKSLIYS